MAFGDNSTIIGPVSATVFNQLATNRFISIIRQASAMLNMAMGEREEGEDGPRFSQDENVSGARIEIPILGEARTITGVTDGAQERAAVTLTPISGMANAITDVAHYPHTVPIENSLITRVQGGRLKAGSFFELVFQQLMESYLETFATALNETGANKGPAQNRLGSWVAAVSDGVSAGESNYSDYYTFDRTDAANAGVRSTVIPEVGVLGLEDIATGQIAIQAKKGRADVGIAGVTVFGIVRQLVEQMTEGHVVNGRVDFSGAKFRYAGTDFMLEAHAPAETLGLFDSRTWMTKQLQKNFTDSGIMPAPWLTASHVLPTEKWVGVFCKEPRKNAKLTGITG